MAGPSSVSSRPTALPPTEVKAAAAKKPEGDLFAKAQALPRPDGLDRFEGILRAPGLPRLDSPSLPPLPALPAVSRPEPFQVMGMTEKQALAHSADEGGSAFSAKHIRGDIANRWSHAAVVKGVDLQLQQLGVPKPLAAALGASVILAKEYLVDLHPSDSDMVVADVEVYHSGTEAKGETKASVSVFGDGAVFVSVKKTF